MDGANSAPRRDVGPPIGDAGDTVGADPIGRRTVGDLPVRTMTIADESAAGETNKLAREWRGPGHSDLLEGGEWRAISKRPWESDWWKASPGFLAGS